MKTLMIILYPVSTSNLIFLLSFQHGGKTTAVYSAELLSQSDVDLEKFRRAHSDPQI